jgi:hypothetical protein
VTRGSDNTRVTTISAAATAADKRRSQWGTAGDGDNGRIGREALSTAETTNDRGTGRHHTGQQQCLGRQRGTKRWGLGAETLGAAALSAAALAIRSCGEEEGKARAYGWNLMNSHAVSNKLCSLCARSQEFNSRGITTWTEREKKNKNTVHNDVTSVTLIINNRPLYIMSVQEYLK